MEATLASHHKAQSIDLLEHQDLVLTIANDYRGRGVDVEVLVAEGRRGLVHARECYQPNLDSDFTTHASYWIKNYICETITLKHQRLIWKLALRFQGRGVDLEDLVQEGQFGLMHASDLFDPVRGNKFSTYASYWIKNYICYAIMNQGGTIRIPAYMHQAIRDGQTPDTPGLSKGRRERLRSALHIQGSMTVGNHDLVGTDLHLADLVVDTREEPPDRDRPESLLPLLDELPAREAAILKMRFGFEPYSQMTLAEVGAAFSITRERVRQIQADALKAIRERLAPASIQPRHLAAIRRFFPETEAQDPKRP